MPTIITRGALSAQGFGFSGGALTPWADQIVEGSNPLQINSSTVDPAGNIIVAGRYVVTAGGFRGFIVKLSPYGSIQWQRQLNNAGSPATAFFDVTTDSSGTIYVCGSSGNATLAQVAKYTKDGAIQWQKSFPAYASGHCGHSIAVDGSGNIYVGGAQTATGRPAIVMLDSSGAFQWGTNFTIGGGSTATDNPVLTTDGTVVYAVFPSTDGGGAVKIDNTGAVIWGTTVNATLLATNANCPILVGSSLYYIGNDGVNTGIFKRNTSTGACTLYYGAQANFASTGVKGGTDGASNIYFGGTVNGSPAGITKADVSAIPTLTWSRYLVTSSGVSNPTTSVNANSTGVFAITFAGAIGLTYRLRTNGTTTGTYTPFTYSAATPPSLSAASPATSQTITGSSFTTVVSTSTLTDSAITATLTHTAFA